jgi:7-cyano-7-deazaguanine synthase
MDGNKFTILEDGNKCCNALSLDFDEVYKRTNTSYKPFPSGNSDYKSASSVERIEAFIKLGHPDPIQYEDESGLVTWEVAKQHAESVIDSYQK